MGGTPHYSGPGAERDSHPNPCNCLTDPSRDLFRYPCPNIPLDTSNFYYPGDDSEEEEDPERDQISIETEPWMLGRRFVSPDRLKDRHTLTYEHYSEEKWQEVSFSRLEPNWIARFAARLGKEDIDSISWMVLPQHENRIGLVFKLATNKEGHKNKFQELSNKWFEPRDPPLQYDDDIFVPLQERLPKDQEERWRLNPHTPIENLLNYLERWSDGRPHFLNRASLETVNHVQESHRIALKEAQTMALDLPKSKIDNTEVKRQLANENRALAERRK